jgi:anaphase-promoting complex subunit 8
LLLSFDDLPFFLSFVRKGLLFYRVSRRAEALECLITSLTIYPWNWSAWLQLSACLEDPEEVSFEK